MANYNLNNLSVFPSNNILKTDSKITTEENVARLIKSLGLKNHVISGLTSFVSGGALVVQSGSAYINGFVIETNSSASLTFTTGTTYYLYMYIKYDVNGHIIGGDTEDVVQGVIIDLIEDNSDSALLDLVKTVDQGVTFQGSLDDFLLLGELSSDGVFVPDEFASIVLDGGSF